MTGFLQFSDDGRHTENDFITGSCLRKHEDYKITLQCRFVFKFSKLFKQFKKNCTGHSVQLHFCWNDSRCPKQITLEIWKKFEKNLLNTSRNQLKNPGNTLSWIFVLLNILDQNDREMIWKGLISFLTTFVLRRND